MGVTCFLSVSTSVTLSAQADINDFIKAQVSDSEIFLEYDHQMMIDSIDALTNQLGNASCALLSSVIAPAITSGATGTDLVENTGAGQTVHTITATAAWPAPTYAIAGTDAALLGVDASTGVVTLTADPDYEQKSSYSFNVTVVAGLVLFAASIAVTLKL